MRTWSVKPYRHGNLAVGLYVHRQPSILLSGGMRLKRLTLGVSLLFWSIELEVYSYV